MTENNKNLLKNNLKNKLAISPSANFDTVFKEKIQKLDLNFEVKPAPGKLLSPSDSIQIKFWTKFYMTYPIIIQRCKQKEI